MDARSYPVAVVWSECRIVRERYVQRVQADAIVMQSVIASMFSKEAGKALQKLLEGMSDVG